MFFYTQCILYVPVERMTVDTSSVFRVTITVLSKVIDSDVGSSGSCVLVVCDPYRPLWDCAVTVYCNSLLGKWFLNNFVGG